MNELFDELRRLGEQIQETMSKITDLMPNKQYNQADDYIKRIYSGAAPARRHSSW